MITIIPIFNYTDFSKTTNLFAPYDYLRRGCGLNYTADPLATDYSPIITQTDQFQTFCEILQIAYPGNVNFTCTDLDPTNDQLPKNSKAFFRQIRPLNNKQEDYSYGYSIKDDLICLDSKIEKENVSYICTNEFIQYYNIITSQSQPQSQIFTKDEFEILQNNLPKQYSYIERFCIQVPQNGKFVQQELQQSMNINYFEFIEDKQGNQLIDQISYIGKQLGGVFVEQIKSQWDTILYGLLVSIGVSIIYFIFLRFFVSIIIWITILGLFGVCLYGSIVLLLTGKSIGDQLDFQMVYLGQVDTELKSQKQLYEGFGWTLVAILILLFIITLCCFNTIRISTNVIQQTMSALGDIPGIFFSPLFGVIFFLIWAVFGCVFGYCIYLSGTYDSKLNQYDFTTLKYDEDNNLVREYDPQQCCIFVFWVFGTIWGIFFIYESVEYFISCAVAKWYFTLNRSRKTLKGTICKSIAYTFKSIGTILVTSFITSLVVIIRFILEYVLKRLEQSNKISDSKVVKAAICIGRCMLKMIQKLVQWFNRNIKIYAAMTGEGYCKSMQISVKLLMSRILTNLFAKGLTSFFLFLGQLLVVISGSVVCSYITYTRKKEIYWAPLIVSLGGGFILSFYIFEIVEIAVDTIYFSFLYEETYLMREREEYGLVYAPGDLKNLLK